MGVRYGFLSNRERDFLLGKNVPESAHYRKVLKYRIRRKIKVSIEAVMKDFMLVQQHPDYKAVVNLSPPRQSFKLKNFDSRMMRARKLSPSEIASFFAPFSERWGKGKDGVGARGKKAGLNKDRWERGMDVRMKCPKCKYEWIERYEKDKDGVVRGNFPTEGVEHNSAEWNRLLSEFREVYKQEN